MFKVDPREDRFSGETRILVKLAKPADRVFLHAQNIDIAKTTVTANGREARREGNRASPMSASSKCDSARRSPRATSSSRFEYTAPFNGKLEGLYKVKVGDDAYAITQMEPISARYAFPGFDEPRFKVPFDLELTVPADEVAVANTRQTAEKKSADGAMEDADLRDDEAAADLSRRVRGRSVGRRRRAADPAERRPQDIRCRLRGIAPRGKGKKLAWVLGETPAVIKFYEDYTRSRIRSTSSICSARPIFRPARWRTRA